MLDKTLKYFNAKNNMGLSSFWNFSFFPIAECKSFFVCVNTEAKGFVLLLQDKSR